MFVCFFSLQGVEASKIIARRDLNNLEKYKMKIKRVSEKTNIDPAVIAAIMSRESHAGTILEDGWGDHGNGFGLMQVKTFVINYETQCPMFNNSKQNCPQAKHSLV